MKYLLPLLAAFIPPLLPIAHSQPIERTIPNSLNETWPLEHVCFEFSPAEIQGPMTCTIQGLTRPTQEERVSVGGKERVRLWTLASVARKDEQGREIPKDGGRDIKRVKATFTLGKVASPLVLKDEGDHFLIDNGIYQFKVRKYQGMFGQATPLGKVPHWIGGMRVKGTGKWDGRAEFQGTGLMHGAKTEIVSQGPVHIDIRITVESEQPAGAVEMVEAVPLTVGKQSFRFGPNEVPSEKIPRRRNHYEALVRFVAEDPWIDVAQRYDFERDSASKPSGFHQETVTFGGKEGMPVDTAMWVRWFEWDKFGGNVKLNFIPAQSREGQNGRPFALLRPVWNQGPGGAQDFFLTSGGATPDKNELKPRDLIDAPAIGIYAAFPSKWVGPYAQTIVCRAENGDSGTWTLPLLPAEISPAVYVPGMRYGQRAFGICVGPRRMFDDTGLINGMVRRHTDWTLQALIHKYILEWPRDPSKVGPNLLVTRARLEKLRHEFTTGKDAAESRVLRKAWAELSPADQTPGNATGGADGDLLRLIVKGSGRSVQPPRTGLWRERRYQDDFLNPTSSPVRSLPNIRMADLLAAGAPVGGPEEAAMAYTICDPDYWMGSKNGWKPGNPNFHTDKYAATLYFGGAMRDHPHSAEWIEFASRNFLADIEEVLLPPDGVGAECPGYSGYAMNLLLPMADAFENLGFSNIPAASPMFRSTGIWHRKLLTPVDARLGRRHAAPIGDTHRWDSGMMENFGKLARFYRHKDPKFASEMMSTWLALQKSGVKSVSSPLQSLLSMDLNLPEVPLESMDWSSQSFHGFGAILRTNFGTPRETFLTYKAGPVRGHYHNDENSFHYYALGTPVSLDYNCSYHPRGDHAALHNSMTFGKLGTVTNNTRKQPVESQEQLESVAHVGAFVSRPAGDLVVSERTGSVLGNHPIEPDDYEFQRDYQAREVGALVHRRLLLMVKHPAGSKMTDYLVVRDESLSQVEQQLNIHLLARGVNVRGRLIEAVGQQGVDMSVFIATGEGPEGGDPRIGVRSWHYSDEFMSGPPEYRLNEGESLEAWDGRMDKLMKSKGASTLPLTGFKPEYRSAVKGETQPWLDHIQKTRGQALIPPKNWTAPWTYGEYQKWLRVETKPGSPILWVLYPYKKGDPQPVIEQIDDRSVKVTHAGETETVSMSSDAGVKVTNGAGEQLILAAGKLPPLGKIQSDPAAVYRGD